MRKKNNPIIESIADPTRSFIAFLFFGILINLLFSGLSDLFWKDFLTYLENTFNLSGVLELKIALLVLTLIVIFILIYLVNLNSLLKKTLIRLNLVDVPYQASAESLIEPCKGLIVIMSPKYNSPAEVAIRYHMQYLQPSILRHCWIICTDKALPHAKEMHQNLISSGCTQNLDFHYGAYEVPNSKSTDAPYPLVVTDDKANDPDSILQLVNSIYIDALEQYKLNESDLIVDFTGGTKPLGVGAFLACTSPDRRLQYITQTDPPQVIEIKISYKLKSS